MAQSLVTFLLIAIATLQIACATYHGHDYYKPKYCPKLKLYYGNVKYTGYKYGYYGYKYGTKASHYCNKCYKLYGDRVRKCDKYGIWDGKAPLCKPIWCAKPPKPKYSKVWYKSTRCGAKAVYKCDYGYYLYGNKSLWCDYTGYWRGKVPKCIPRRRYGHKYGGKR